MSDEALRELFHKIAKSYYPYVSSGQNPDFDKSMWGAMLNQFLNEVAAHDKALLSTIRGKLPEKKVNGFYTLSRNGVVNRMKGAFLSLEAINSILDDMEQQLNPTQPIPADRERKKQ